jgi:hypothetical protein
MPFHNNTLILSCAQGFRQQSFVFCRNSCFQSAGLPALLCIRASEANRTLPLYKRMNAVEFSTEPLPRNGAGKLLRQ